MRRVLMRCQQAGAGGEAPWGRAAQAGPGAACLLGGNGTQAALAEQYRMLRTSLQRGGQRHGPRSILVTSSLPGEGKSTVAANLAIAVARSGAEQVLLIDGDLRNPSLARLFGLRAAAGLADYLRGEAGLENLLLPTHLAGLSLLPAGRAAPEAAALLGSERMRALLAAVSLPQRLVVLDSPPLLLAADPAVLSSQVDAVLLVVRAGLAEREAVARAIEPLGAGKLLGVVFNGLEPEAGDWRGKYLRHYYRGAK